ncbi:extracellular solute-binding protein [Paenibacillus eucommiae]|uniref:Aldouronate transport system substrate-binding protein n=1 Tax=Paenibacillus eucommiae TaxID=1355755 RepID=A0ABS4IM45_9BACL|nr:extracellular solute-binding protein [Paenibacillus eucommiae]MBP1988647.1 putative aldouronate transport system substrate-binding protein [Paenibacillus eucommiae]
MICKRKHIAITSLLIFAMLLSACAGNNGKTETNASSPAGTTAGTTAGETTKTEKSKISILTTSAAAYNQTVANWKESPYLKKVEELTNTDLDMEFLSWADYQTQLTLRFASNELADLVQTSAIDAPAHANAVEQGAILELNELIDKYGPTLKAKIPERVWKDPAVSKDGKIYAIPGLVPNAHTVVPYIREDWLKKAEMEMPVTLDDWVAYFEKVKTMDMNGNGDPNDEYGFYVRENLGSSDMFFYEFGVAQNHWVVQGEEYVPSVITPNMKEALAFWRKLYKNGYINPNFLTNKYADWQAGITNGKAGSWLHYVDNIANMWSPDKFIDQPDVKVTAVEPPVGPHAQGAGLANTGMYYVWIIPSKTKNPEKVIQLLDKAWSNEELQKFYSFGLEGHNHEVVDGKIKWDPSAPNNATNGESFAYQADMNFTGHSINNAEEVKMSPFAEQLERGFAISEKYKIEADSMYMPIPEAFKTRPELLPNFASGATLLLDMFAKVITSDVDIDAEFDKFVQEWRSRGGNDAIKQATEWHNKFIAN